MRNGNRAGLAMVIVWAALFAIYGCQSSRQTKPAITQPSVTEMRAALGAILADDLPYSALNSRAFGHIQVLPNSFWYALFRPRYAHEKLIAKGNVIIEPLLKVVSDPAEDKDKIERAWIVLFEFDDLRISAALIEQAKTRGLSQFDAYILVAQDIGIHDVIMEKAGVDEQAAVQWLETMVATGDYSPVLKLLDAAMEDDRGFGLLFGAEHLIRWLNRYGDLDIDEWLARENPEALAWRNEQLSKGFDPIVAFRPLRQAFAEHQLDHAVARIYSDARDRRLCRALLVAVYSRIDQGEPKGWEDNLRKWYRANRERFVYDFQKHRFIVGSPAQGTAND